MIKNPLLIAFAMVLKDIKHQYMFVKNIKKVEDAEKEISDASHLSHSILRQMQAGNNVPSPMTIQRLADSPVFQFDDICLQGLVKTILELGKKVECFWAFKEELREHISHSSYEARLLKLLEHFMLDVPLEDSNQEKCIIQYLQRHDLPQVLCAFLRGDLIEDKSTDFEVNQSSQVGEKDKATHREIGALNSREITDIGSSHINKFWCLQFKFDESLLLTAQDFVNNLSELSQRSVIVAPGGYGKTTLLRGMCAELESRGNKTLYIAAATLSQKISDLGIEPILDKLQDVMSFSEYLVIDGLDDFIKYNDPKKGASIVRKLLAIELDDHQKLLMSIRDEHYQMFFSNDDFLGFSVVSLFTWNSCQLSQYFSERGIHEFPNNLLSVLRIPFYAELYSNISSRNVLNQVDKYSLVREYISRDIDSLSRVSDDYGDVVFNICEEIAWRQRRGEYLGTLEIDDVISTYSQSFSLNDFLSFSIISVRFGEVTFTHDLYREHFIARRIINKMCYSNYLPNLADFQTSYEEDSFVAEVISKNNRILKQLVDVNTENLGDIEAVNMAGILAKTLNPNAMERAVAITLSKPTITELYRKAVFRRLNLHNIDDLNLGDLVEELESGGDPIAAYFMVEATQSSPGSEVLRIAVEKKYPEILKLWECENEVS